MSREHKYFNYYCLDRLRSMDNELPISYKDDGLIRKIYYKIGLIAKIKNTRCCILYDEDDFENLVYSSCEFIDNHREELYLNIQDKQTIKENIKEINTINIFEFTSLLNFEYIYSEFKDIIDYNWNNLNMDSLVEI